MCSIHHCLQLNAIHLWLCYRVLRCWRSWINGAELWYDLHWTDKGRIDAGHRLLMSNKTSIWPWMRMANDKLSSLEHGSNITWMSWWMFSGTTLDCFAVPQCVRLDCILSGSLSQFVTSTFLTLAGIRLMDAFSSLFKKKKSMLKQLLAIGIEWTRANQPISILLELAGNSEQHGSSSFH